MPPSGLVQIKHDAKFDVDIFNPLGGTRFSWIVEILPFMEEQALFDKFDHSKQILFQDQNPQAMSLSTLMCPSDSSAGRTYQYSDLGRTIECAKGNYAAFTSPFHIDLQLLYPAR